MLSRRALTPVLALLPLLAVVGCDNSLSTGADPKVEAPVASAPSGQVTDQGDFCTDLLAMNAKAKGAKTAAAGLQVLRGSLPKLTAEQASVPTRARDDYDVVISAAKTAVTTKDLTVLTAEQLVAAGTRLVAACGR